MSEHLERRLADERRRWTALVEVDDGTQNVFEDLCRRSRTSITRTMPFHPSMDPDSAFCPASGAKHYGLGGDLELEWLGYRDRWTAFAARNPRVRIASIMEAIGETHDYSGWPTGRETTIRIWVRAGMPEPRPFDDRMSIDTAEWRAALADAAAATGDGWVYAEGDVLVWKSD